MATRRVAGLLGALALVACAGGGPVPRCEGDVLIRACTERECVEGGYTEDDGRVHQVCTSGRCIEANGTAECVADPLEACTHDTCDAGWRVVCGATGYVTGLAACDDGSACTSGADWAGCGFADLPCTTPGDFFCANDAVYRCGDHGVADALEAACTGGAACVTAADQTFCGYADLPCPADTGSFCNDDQLCKCAWGADFVYEKRPCAGGLACVEFEFDGSTEAECAFAERPCDAGASTCEPGLLVICGASGFEIARLDCETCEEPEAGRAECR